MLNTRELRIGNWVMTDKPEQAVDVLCDSLSTTTHKCMTMDNLSPIGLTPDILIKCGFKEHDTFKQFLLPCTGGLLSHQCYEGVHGVAYERDWEDDLIEPHNDLFITSLHRLQNFYYAVTGEELQVDL